MNMVLVMEFTSFTCILNLICRDFIAIFVFILRLVECAIVSAFGECCHLVEMFCISELV